MPTSRYSYIKRIPQSIKTIIWKYTYLKKNELGQIMLRKFVAKEIHLDIYYPTNGEHSSKLSFINSSLQSKASRQKSSVAFQLKLQNLQEIN